MSGCFIPSSLLAVELAQVESQKANELASSEQTASSKLKKQRPSEAKSQTIKAKKRMPKRLHSDDYIRERMSLGFGTYYSTGEYGTDKSTDIYSIPLRASYGRDDWRISAQLPFLYINGPANVIAISDGAEVVEKVAEGERTRWGNGDLRVTGQYRVYADKFQKLGLRLGSTIKFPVASDDSELGSGEFDYSFFAGGHIRSGRWVTNGRLGYQFMGDTPDTDYNNRAFGSIGGYYRIDKHHSAGVNYYYKEAALDTSDPVNTTSVYFNKRLADGWRVSFSLGAGLSEASADIFGGMQFTKRFTRKRRIEH